MKQMYIFLSGIPLFTKEIVQIIYVPQSKYLCFEKDVLSLQSDKKLLCICLNDSVEWRLRKLSVTI